MRRRRGGRKKGGMEEGESNKVREVSHRRSRKPTFTSVL